jgi:hypothetical protein
MSILINDESEAPDLVMSTNLATEALVKTCSGPCGRRLPLTAFDAASGRRDGRRSECKECRRERRGPRGREGRSALELEGNLQELLDAYAEPSLADVLSRALEEVRQIGAAGERRAAQVEAVRQAVLLHGCRRVEEIVEETRLSRWVVDSALEGLVAAGVLETRDAFRLVAEAEEAGRPVVEYHPRAYPRGEGFSRLFRRDDQDEQSSLEVEA